MALIFLCEDGVNPAPPGVFVTLSDGSGTTVGSAWSLIDGSVAIPIQAATPYVAKFRSTQIQAADGVSFSGNAMPGADTVVSVPGATPTLYSPEGSAYAQAEILPKGMVDASELLPGGGAFAILEGTSSGLASIDASIARLIGSLRGQTAIGFDADLDAWAADYFGPYVRRYPGEDSPTFFGRCLALMGPRRTLASIQAVVVAFYAATLNERIVAALPNLALDQAGGFDTSGGYDIVNPPPVVANLTPTVSVWDADSQPTLAAQYGIDWPRFVVRIGFANAARAWYLDKSFLDIDTFLLDEGVVQTTTAPPDPRLGDMVNLVKAGGTRPVYQFYAS